MNFCGWNPLSGEHRQQHMIRNSTSMNQTRPSFQPIPSIKFSVKNSAIQIQQKHNFYAPSQITNQKLKQSQQTNVGSVSRWIPSTQHSPSLQISRKDSLIDRISQNNYKDDIQSIRSARVFQYGKQSRFHNSYEKPRTQDCQQRQSFNAYSDPQLQQSYADLIKQNMMLKKVINDQYQPLKQMYTKLKTEHEDRQFLVSQLQWKVKQLAKDIKSRKF